MTDSKPGPRAFLHRHRVEYGAIAAVGFGSVALVKLTTLPLGLAAALTVAVAIWLGIPTVTGGEPS